MIKILIQGNELVLYKSTSIDIELNNAMFATDSIEGDVAYSFDIPIAGNEISLDFEHDPHTNHGKRWPCTLLYNGIQFIFGYSFDQNASTGASCYIKEYRMYNRVLTLSEIRQIQGYE